MSNKSASIISEIVFIFFISDMIAQNLLPLLVSWSCGISTIELHENCGVNLIIQLGVFYAFGESKDEKTTMILINLM